MNYAIEDIAQVLKAARHSKGLSQRELGKKAGVPQGHISNIENATVDLRLSSLIALARILDLELTLVPRKAVPAIQSIVRRSEHSARGGSEDSRLALKELQQLQNAIANLPTVKLPPAELAQLQRQARDLQHFALSPANLEAIRAARRTLDSFLSDRNNVKAVRESMSMLHHLRNTLAHGASQTLPSEAARPAYSLDEDDNG